MRERGRQGPGKGHEGEAGAEPRNSSHKWGAYSAGSETMTECILNAFRSSATSACSCEIISAGNVWYTGDELGRLYKFSAESESELKVRHEDSGYQQIECVASSRSGEYLALACENTLNVKSVADMAVCHPMAIRSTLPITHVEFDHDDSHM